MHAIIKNALRAALCAVLASAGAHAANPMLGEIEIHPAGKTERSAGVWVDGQYMGYVKQLRGKSRLFLLPGEHELVFRLVGYEEVRQSIVVEPGGHSEYRLTLQQKADVRFPTEEQTAELVLSVEPENAAVFVNDRYAGHVDRFDGARGMRLRAGTYRIEITLPGYQPFETEMTLRAGRSYEIATELARGTIAEQDDKLIVGRRE